MIEVGWSPDDAPAPAEAVQGTLTPGNDAITTATGSEAVHDHYAALQAWREWSENQARRTPRSNEPAAPALDEDELDPDANELVDLEAEARLSPLADRPAVRAEGEQKFAPFGQLFSKMAQSIDPE